MVQQRLTRTFHRRDGDCNDYDPDISPAAEEICDNIDNNCNNIIDEEFENQWFSIDRDRDGWGDESVQVWECAPPFGYVEKVGDCNDLNPTIYPTANERCNEVDDNCNEVIDGV